MQNIELSYITPIRITASQLGAAVGKCISMKLFYANKALAWFAALLKLPQASN